MASIEYRSHEGVPSDEAFDWIASISQEIFGPGMDAAELRRGLEGKQHILACLAFEDDEPVGYKLGYMERANYFESWRGGVVPAARRRGIANELQRIQHAWCKDQGFRIITTTTEGHNAPMLILNLQHDYKIVGTFFDRGQNLKVILQKQIDGGAQSKNG
jgi:predicted GNAT superfamily acetyltransferase